MVRERWGIPSSIFGRGAHLLLLLPVLALLVSILIDPNPRPRSRYAFDEIETLVAGKTAGQVLELLGTPDTRRPTFVDGERWIWWRFTTLEGPDHPPELRGRIVHLEIVFRDPDGLIGASNPHEAWTIDEIQGVTFQLPQVSP